MTLLAPMPTVPVRPIADAPALTPAARRAAHLAALERRLEEIDARLRCCETELAGRDPGKEIIPLALALEIFHLEDARDDVEAQLAAFRAVNATALRECVK